MEVQVTAEEEPVGLDQFEAMRALAAGGIASLVARQRAALGC